MNFIRSVFIFINAVILLTFLGAVGIFAAQNTQAIPVKFLSYGVTAPLPLLTVVAYVLGMVSGWNVVAFLRRSIREVSVDPNQR